MPNYQDRWAWERYWEEHDAISEQIDAAEEAFHKTRPHTRAELELHLAHIRKLKDALNELEFREECVCEASKEAVGAIVLIPIVFLLVLTLVFFRC